MLVIAITLTLVTKCFGGVNSFLYVSHVLMFNPFFCLKCCVRRPILRQTLQPICQEIIMPTTITVYTKVLTFNSGLGSRLNVICRGVSCCRLSSI